MANYSSFIPAVGSTTYPIQISNFITISEAFDTEIENARQGEANLLDSINLKLNLSGGTMTGSLTLSSGTVTIGSDTVAVKDAALTDTIIVSADASGRITTSSGIVAANIIERAGTLTSGDVAVVTTNNDIQTTGIVAVNVVERSGTLTSGDVAVVTTGNDIQTTGLVATNLATLSGTQTLTGNKTFSGTNDFSGITTAVTQSSGNNTTRLATTAFVTTAIGIAQAFPSGTKMVFQQTSAPTGWTKVTTHNNKAFRVVSGSAGTGGSVAFTTAFANKGVSGSVSNTSLSTAQLAAHTHGTPIRDGGTSAGSSAASTATSNPDRGISTFSAGSGNSHSHTFSGTAINMAVQYVDLIIATKD